MVRWNGDEERNLIPLDDVRPKPPQCGHEDAKPRGWFDRLLGKAWCPACDREVYRPFEKGE